MDAEMMIARLSSRLSALESTKCVTMRLPAPPYCKGGTHQSAPTSIYTYSAGFWKPRHLFPQRRCRFGQLRQEWTGQIRKQSQVP